MAEQKKPLSPTMRSLTAALAWMRVAHEDDAEELDGFDTLARVLKGSVAALEAEAGPNAPELRRLRGVEKRLQLALVHRHNSTHGHRPEGCDGCTLVTEELKVALGEDLLEVATAAVDRVVQ